MPTAPKMSNSPHPAEESPNRLPSTAGTTEFERMRNFTFKLPDSLVEELKKIARRNGKRYQSVTRQALVDYVRAQTPV